MVLRMYDQSVRYDFSKGGKPNAINSRTASLTTTSPHGHNPNSTRTAGSAVSSERSLSWRDADTSSNSRRHFGNSQRGSGFNVPPPYAPYVPTGSELTISTTNTAIPSSFYSRIPKDSLELGAPSPCLEERFQMHQTWFSKRRSRPGSDDATTPTDTMLAESNALDVLVRFMAQLLPILQFIATFQVWWNQWLEFRLKLTAKRRIARALVNLKAAWAWKEQHAVIANDAAVENTAPNATTVPDSNTHVPPQWSLREIVGDVGMALFSPLHEEAFEPLPVPIGTVAAAAYVAPSATTMSSTADVAESRQEEEEEAAAFAPSSNNRNLKRESGMKWEFVAVEDEAAVTSELEEDDEVEDDADEDGYEMLEEYPVEVVPEDPAELKDCPRILTDDFLQQLVDEGLPDELKMNKWQRVFAIGRDGDNFLTMVEYSARFRYTLVAMKTTTGHVLGGFASERWNSPPSSGGSGGGYNNRRQSYYGTGQSFLFTTHPGVVAQQQEEKVPRRRSNSRPPPPKPLVAIFKWTGANEYCQICDIEKGTLAMGGGGAFGLIVQDDFNRGVTSSCFTFGNPCLIPDENDGRFEIESFEVYGLIPWLTESSISSSCGSSVLLSSSPPHVSPGRRSRSCSLY